VKLPLGTLTPDLFHSLLRSFDTNLFQRHDSNGSLPLHTACSSGANMDTIRLLVECGGVETLHARDNSGALPLHRFLGANPPPALNTLEYLVNAYPESLLVSTNEGLLPFAIASRSLACSADILLLLLKACPSSLALSVCQQNPKGF